MTIKDVFNLRKYSLEDMIYHELKAMGKTQFNMTSLSENQLPIPINGTYDTNAILSSVGGEQDLDAGIPIIASDYKMPSLRNFQNHPIPSNYWIPNKQQNNAAINKYSDKGPLGHQILIRKVSNIRTRLVKLLLLLLLVSLLFFSCCCFFLLLLLQNKTKNLILCFCFRSFYFLLLFLHV